MRIHSQHPRSPRSRTLAAALATVALALPLAAHAQSFIPAGAPRAAAAASRADVLDARAAAIEDTHHDSSDLLVGAVLREGAARLRAATDPRRMESLRRAGFGRYYAGDLAAAGALLEASADEAAALGDLRQAVSTYLDAASVTREAGQLEHARRTLGKAVTLARSRQQSAEQRRALQAEIARRFRP